MSVLKGDLFYSGRKDTEKVFGALSCTGCYKILDEKLVPFVRRLIRVLILVSLPFLAWGYGKETLRTLWQANLFARRGLAFFLGIVTFVPVWFAFRRRLAFFVTMEHELTHLFVGLLFLKTPKSFHVTDVEGGAVHMLGSNFLIGLAPYFLPTASYLLLPLPLILSRQYRFYFVFMLGLTVMYHFCSTLGETRLNQPDIQSAGVLFSCMFIPVANLICYGGLIAFAISDYAGFTRFWIEGLKESYAPLGAPFGL